jgi:hypothetical protein
MTRRPWRSELVLKDSRARLNVTSSSRRLLSADLPYLGEEALALRHILEGLALWQGPPLLLACDVDGLPAAGCGKARVVPGLLVPPSPLVRASIGVRVTDRGES